MNREEAIKWVRITYPDYWPNSTKYAFPNGWRWVVVQKPYCVPSYKLVSSKYGEIKKGDI